MKQKRGSHIYVEIWGNRKQSTNEPNKETATEGAAREDEGGGVEQPEVD